MLSEWVQKIVYALKDLMRENGINTEQQEHLSPNTLHVNFAHLICAIIFVQLKTQDYGKVNNHTKHHHLWKDKMVVNPFHRPVHFYELLTRLSFLTFKKIMFLCLSANHQQKINYYSQSHRNEPEIYIHQKVLLNSDLQKLM